MHERNYQYYLAIGLTLILMLEPVHSTDCPDTWTAYEGSCYLFAHGKPMNFFEAEHFCKQHEGHLVHIENAAENAFLEDFIRPYKESFWTGLTDERVEGQWLWYGTNNKANYTNWDYDQPNNLGNNEDCVRFYTASNLKWNDAPCTTYTCEPLCEIRVSDSAPIIG